MGWQIIGRQRYYYRIVWNGHRQVAIYCGSGARGERAAAEDAERAAARRAVWARHAEQRALAVDVEAAAGPAADLANALMIASLLTSGLHHSMSNGWRRRRRG
jgi:hypothetical protein